MITQEIIFDILEKLIGSVKPIGETNYDEKVLENQEKLMFVVDKCIELLIANSKLANNCAFSINKIGGKSEEYLKELSNYITNECAYR